MATRGSRSGLTGFETFDIVGLDAGLKPRATLTVRVTPPSGKAKEFKVLARIDTPEEMNYYKNGGILAVRAAAAGLRALVARDVRGYAHVRERGAAFWDSGRCHAASHAARRRA